MARELQKGTIITPLHFEQLLLHYFHFAGQSEKRFQDFVLGGLVTKRGDERVHASDRGGDRVTLFP